MTINQILDKLSQVKNPNQVQQDMKVSLHKAKMDFGGRTQVENVQQIENVIQHGYKEDEQA